MKFKELYCVGLLKTEDDMPHILCQARTSFLSMQKTRQAEVPLGARE